MLSFYFSDNLQMSVKVYFGDDRLIPMCPPHSSGIVNVLVTTPLWVVNTRLKLQGSKFRNADIRPTNYSGILGKCPSSISVILL